MTYLPFVLMFCLFMITLHPSITAGDGGEIVAAGFSLGIPHPPGYPLHATVGKLFILLFPLGSVAYRVNVASAVFGALTCMMVYLITHKIVDSRGQGSVPALFAAFSLALSYELWYRSTVAEVYTLNTFLILTIIYTLLIWKGDLSFTDSTIQRFNNSRLLYLASFLFGLGIGNHHTIVLVIPGAVAFVCLVGRDALGVGSRKPEVPLIAHCSLLIAFFLLGLSVYLYLPLRSVNNPFIDWGDPQSLGNFIDVFTRRTYLPEGIERTWERLWEQVKTFNPVWEFSPLGFVLGLLGIWGAFRQDKATGAMLILTFLLAGYGLIFLAGSSKGDMDLLKKFYLPSYAVFSILMGVGIATGMAHGARRTASYALCSLLYALCAVSLIWQFSAHYPKTRNSGNYLAYDYGMNELNSLREGAAYISKGELKTFPLWYFQGVERFREDVKVITAYFLTQRWYLPEVLRTVGVPREIPQGLTYKQMLVDSIYRGNADKGVYTGFLDEEYISGDLLKYTRGITFQIYKDPKETAPEDVWPLYQLRGLRKVEEGMERGMVEILKDYASSHYNTGLEYYEKEDKERAAYEFEKALGINPDDPDSLNNLAALYAEKGIRLKEAEELAARAFDLYTGEGDKAIARETLGEVRRKLSR